MTDSTTTFGNIIVIRKNGLDGSCAPLEERETLFGRHPDCDIRIQINTVSRKHAKITVDEDNKVWLHPLSEAQPTIHNDKILTSPILLQDKDVFDICGRLFRFDLAPKDKARTPDRKNRRSSVTSSAKKSPRRTPLSQRKTVDNASNVGASAPQMAALMEKLARRRKALSPGSEEEEEVEEEEEEDKEAVGVEEAPRQTLQTPVRQEMQQGGMDAVEPAAVVAVEPFFPQEEETLMFPGAPDDTSDFAAVVRRLSLEHSAADVQDILEEALVVAPPEALFKNLKKSAKKGASSAHKKKFGSTSKKVASSKKTPSSTTASGKKRLVRKRKSTAASSSAKALVMSCDSPVASATVASEGSPVPPSAQTPGQEGLNDSFTRRMMSHNPSNAVTPLKSSSEKNPPQSLLLRAGAERANVPDLEDVEQECGWMSVEVPESVVEEDEAQECMDVDPVSEAKTPATLSRADRRKSVQWSERIESTSPAVGAEEPIAPTSILAQKRQQRLATPIREQIHSLRAAEDSDEEKEEEEEEVQSRPRLKTPLRNELAQAVASKKRSQSEVAAAEQRRLKTPLRKEIAEAAAQKREKGSSEPLQKLHTPLRREIAEAAAKRSSTRRGVGQDEDPAEEEEPMQRRLKTPLRKEIAQAVANKKAEAEASSSGEASRPKLKTPLKREIAAAVAAKQKEPVVEAPKLKTPLKREILQAAGKRQQKKEADVEQDRPKLQTPLRKEIASAASKFQESRNELNKSGRQKLKTPLKKELLARAEARQGSRVGSVCSSSSNSASPAPSRTSARLATPLRSEIAVAGQRALQQQEDRQISSKAMPKLGTPLRKDIQAGNFQLLPVPMPEEQQQQQEEEQEAEMEQGQVHEIDEIFSEVAEQQEAEEPVSAEVQASAKSCKAPRPSLGDLNLRRLFGEKSTKGNRQSLGDLELQQLFVELQEEGPALEKRVKKARESLASYDLQGLFASLSEEHQQEVGCAEQLGDALVSAVVRSTLASPKGVADIHMLFASAEEDESEAEEEDESEAEEEQKQAEDSGESTDEEGVEDEDQENADEDSEVIFNTKRIFSSFEEEAGMDVMSPHAKSPALKRRKIGTPAAFKDHSQFPIKSKSKPTRVPVAKFNPNLFDNLSNAAQARVLGQREFPFHATQSPWRPSNNTRSVIHTVPVDEPEMAEEEEVKEQNEVAEAEAVEEQNEVAEAEAVEEQNEVAEEEAAEEQNEVAEAEAVEEQNEVAEEEAVEEQNEEAEAAQVAEDDEEEKVEVMEVTNQEEEESVAAPQEEEKEEEEAAPATRGTRRRSTRRTRAPSPSPQPEDEAPVVEDDASPARKAPRTRTRRTARAPAVEAIPSPLPTRRTRRRTTAVVEEPPTEAEEENMEVEVSKPKARGKRGAAAAARSTRRKTQAPVQEEQEQEEEQPQPEVEAPQKKPARSSRRKAAAAPVPVAEPPVTRRSARLRK